MVSTMTQLQTKSSIGTVVTASMRMIHTMVEAVLTLPDHAAAMTSPRSAAIIRRADTANSLASTTSSIHAAIRPHSTNTHIAAVTSILSAMGSTNFPKSVTMLQRRAICPSRKSLMLAMTKMASPTHAL